VFDLAASDFKFGGKVESKGSTHALIRYIHGPILMMNPEITQSHTDVVDRQMQRMALRNPSWNIQERDFKSLFPYLAVQKITFLYDDEMRELLQWTDCHRL
jgi:hypothetical protein